MSAPILRFRVHSGHEKDNSIDSSYIGGRFWQEISTLPGAGRGQIPATPPCLLPGYRHNLINYLKHIAVVAAFPIDFLAGRANRIFITPGSGLGRDLLLYLAFGNRG